jgi:hypothetical protein
MTIKEMTEKIIEVEKRDGLTIHFAYETDKRAYGFYVYRDNARLVRRFPVDEMVKWAIEDFEAQIERMSDEIWQFINYNKSRKIKEVVE